MSNWIRIEEQLPPEKKLVLTKIHDGYGSRNEEKLFRSGKLWFVEGGGIYVYYTPTHWKNID